MGRKIRESDNRSLGVKRTHWPWERRRAGFKEVFRRSSVRLGQPTGCETLSLCKKMRLHSLLYSLSLTWLLFILFSRTSPSSVSPKVVRVPQISCWAISSGPMASITTCMLKTRTFLLPTPLQGTQVFYVLLHTKPALSRSGVSTLWPLQATQSLSKYSALGL